MSKSANNLNQTFAKALASAGVSDDNVQLNLAVSGGADSSALVDLAFDWCNAGENRSALVAHFNHQLRPEAADEEFQVRRLAERYNLEFVSGSGDVSLWAKEHDLSIHTAARNLRYNFLAEVAREVQHSNPSQAQVILTAHHADDQIETVLMRLFSGSGIEGLAGIRLRSTCPGAPEIPLVRPLLNIRKSDLIELCRSRNISFADDSSNLDETFPRSNIRVNILPQIGEKFGGGTFDSMLRSISLLQHASDIIVHELEKCLNDCVIESTRFEIIVDYRAFSSYYYLIRLAIIQRCAHTLGGDELRIPLERCETAEQNLSESEKVWQLGSGINIRRYRDKIYLYSESGEWGESRFQEGTIELPGLGALSIELISSDMVTLPPPAGTLFIDARTLDGAKATIRPAKPGDTMTPLGAIHPCSVFDLLRDAHIPQHKRNMPIIETAGTIAALIPVRIAHHYRLTEQSRQAYRLTLSNPSVEIKTI